MLAALRPFIFSLLGPYLQHRKGSEHPGGWPMRREQYEEFMSAAKDSSNR